MDKTDIQFNSQGYKLSGTLYKPNEAVHGALLILGGGAHIPHKEGYYPLWQNQLLKNGIASFTFDFTGVGESEGKLEETNIITRFRDAESALDTFLSHLNIKNVHVAGISMGAPVAINLANNFNINGLILVSPGAYSKEARDKNFGPEFSTAIREPNSWQGSPDFEGLQKFEGGILLAYGKMDKIVPTEILEIYAHITEENTGEVLAFDGVGHRFMRELDESSAHARKVLQDSLTSLIMRSKS